MEFNLERCGRHLHLTIEDYNILFPKQPMPERKKALSVIGEYQIYNTVTLIGKNGKAISNVAVIFPPRNFSYVEVSRTDLATLGIRKDVYFEDEVDTSYNPEVRVISDFGEVYLPIGIQLPHIHVSPNIDIKEKRVNLKVDTPYLNLTFYDVKVKRNKGVKGVIIHTDNDIYNSIMLGIDNLTEVEFNIC